MSFSIANAVSDKLIKVYSLSTDVALVMAKRFLRSMAQPFDQDQAGLSLWAVEDIEARQMKEQEGLGMHVDGEEGQQPGGPSDQIFEGLEDQAMVDAMMEVDDDM